MALVLLNPLKSGRRVTQKRNKELPELCGAQPSCQAQQLRLSEGQKGPVREVRLEGGGGAEQGQRGRRTVGGTGRVGVLGWGRRVSVTCEDTAGPSQWISRV